MTLDELSSILNVLAALIGAILGILITLFIVIVPDIKSIKSKDR